MNQTGKIVAVGMLAAVVGAGLAIGYGVSADTEEGSERCGGRGEGRGEKSQEWQERHSRVEAAVESGDYGAWRAAVGEVDSPRSQKMLGSVNEQNFSRLAEAHKLKEEGNFSDARAIMEEIGVGAFGKGDGYGMHRGRWNK